MPFPISPGPTDGFYRPEFVLAVNGLWTDRRRPPSRGEIGYRRDGSRLERWIDRTGAVENRRRCRYRDYGRNDRRRARAGYGRTDRLRGDGRTLVDGSGLELLEAIRERDATLPVVLAPVDGDESLASEAITAGVTEYVAADRSPGARSCDRTCDRDRSPATSPTVAGPRVHSGVRG